jgi:hypothetical protein
MNDQGMTRGEIRIVGGLRSWFHKEAIATRCRAPLTGSKALVLSGAPAAELAAIREEAARIFGEYDTLALEAEGGPVTDPNTGRAWPAGRMIPVTTALALYEKARTLLTAEADICRRWAALFPVLWQTAANALAKAEQAEQGRRRALAAALATANGEALHPDRVTAVGRLLPNLTHEREEAAAVAQRLGNQRASIAARADWIAKTVESGRVGVLPWERE